jgi:DNA-binding MarR family transcriptional regulator
MWQPNQRSSQSNPDQVSLTHEDAQEVARLLSILVPGERTVSSLIRRVDWARRSATPSLPPDRRVLVDTANRIYVGRRVRERHLPDFMFGEPAWDMMLVLYATGDSGSRLTVSRLLEFGEVPHTTGLRYVVVLEEHGLIIRKPNPVDRRMVFVELSDKGRQAMDLYMADILQLD